MQLLILLPPRPPECLAGLCAGVVKLTRLTQTHRHRLHVNRPTRLLHHKVGCGHRKCDLLLCRHTCRVYQWLLAPARNWGWCLTTTPSTSPHLADDDGPSTNDHDGLEVLALLDLIHGCLPGQQVAIAAGGSHGNSSSTGSAAAGRCRHAGGKHCRAPPQRQLWTAYFALAVKRRRLRPLGHTQALLHAVGQP